MRTLEGSNEGRKSRRPAPDPLTEPRRRPYRWADALTFVGNDPRSVLTAAQFGTIRKACGAEAAAAATLTVAYRIATGHPPHTNPAGVVREIALCYRNRCRIDTEHGPCGHQALIEHRSRWADWLQAQPSNVPGLEPEPTHALGAVLSAVAPSPGVGHQGHPEDSAEMKPRRYEPTPPTCTRPLVTQPETFADWLEATPPESDPQRRTADAWLELVPIRYHGAAADQWAINQARRAILTHLAGPPRGRAGVRS